MRRGTTPTILLTVTGLSEIVVNKVYLTIKQRSRKVEKGLSELDISGDEIRAELTQEETLSFMAEDDVEIQLRVLSRTGTAYATNIITEPVGAILKDGVIGDGKSEN